jgi:glycosyltransferase involved in cell wall biosynthesis
MRALLLTKNFPPRSCGVGDYACRLAEELAAAGNSVTVLTEPAESPRHLLLGLREVPLRGWRDLRAALAEIAEAAPDRVQFEYSGYAWGRWGTAWWVNVLLFRLRRQGIPVHLGLHELAISMRQHPLQTPVALAQWLHAALLIAAVRTVAVNMRSRAELLGRLFPWWRAKVCYRPNSSTIPVVSQSGAERELFRRERGVSAGEIVVGTFGLFHRAKNYEGLIEAAALLGRKAASESKASGHSDAGRPVRLWMLGNAAVASPEYIARLKRVARESGIEDAVWWPGRLEADEISRALQATDVFVLPQPDGHLTRSSAFMAAAAHGLPVVAVRQPGGRDQAEFTHGEHLWLAEHSTAEDLAASIKALSTDRGAAMRMGHNLRKLYETRFDWRIAAADGRSARGEAAPAPSVARTASAEGSNAVTAAHAGGAKP